jgi:hypothetical protein
LRYNVAAETASGASDPHDAMLEDIETLLTAVAPVGGDVVLIADTTRARMMPARSRGGVLPPVLGSSAINTDDLLAVSTDALACAMSPDIELKTSREAVAHFEDNAPLPISVPGTPNTISAPTISLFQIDGIGQRLKLGVTWQKRHEDTCAWMTTTAW